jgi:catechol 2,3-dioxygenase-like lactoylglutathione lyase family enzyme
MPGEATMFKNTKAFSGFSVDDLAAAKTFYGETLGIDVTDEQEMEILILELAGGERPTVVYLKADHQPATFTILNFPATDVGGTVAALKTRGVEFETYAGTPLETDEDGVFRGDEGPEIAWFKDPAGNVLSVIEDDGSDR